VPSDSESIASRLARLTADLQAVRASRPRRDRGRPTQLAIRKHFYRCEIYLAPDMVRALDRIATHMQQRAGAAISRSDLVRQAIEQYLRHAPGEGDGEGAL
jgi:hypothetical protein